MCALCQAFKTFKLVEKVFFGRHVRPLMQVGVLVNTTLRCHPLVHAFEQSPPPFTMMFYYACSKTHITQCYENLHAQPAVYGAAFPPVYQNRQHKGHR